MATCPRCGADASGNFCSSCGASLKSKPCPSCGATPEVGARFCNHCGVALGAMGGAAAATASVGAAEGGAPKGGGASRAKAHTAGQEADQSRLGWILAGVFFVAMLVVLALPILRPDQAPPAPTGPVAGSGGGVPPDISQMTPREAADALWTRIMEADATGNTAEVQRFMPMALQAYEMAAPLDLDGRYHVALLHDAAGDFAAALEVSRGILDENPDYLLALASAAEASKELGDTEAARDYYRRFLDAYDREMAKGLQEYSLHINGLTLSRQEAVQFTGP